MANEGAERRDRPPGGERGRAERPPGRGSADHPPAGTPDERAEHMRELDRARRGRVAKIVVALVLLVLFILFVIRNSQPVSEADEGIDFIFFQADVALIWVFLSCAVIGGLIGYLLGRPTKEQRGFIKDAESERR